MTLLLNVAIEPGFVALQQEGVWTWAPLGLGRGASFPGVAVEQLGVAVRSITEIVVVNGPGSSTGLRIACSYANALALASGARIFVLPSFEIASLFHPEHPERIAFRQPLGRIVVASRSVDGQWAWGDAEEIPQEVQWTYEPSQLSVDPEQFSGCVRVAQESSLAIPRYWAAPLITTKKGGH